jgi:hypothetical protein
MQGFITKDKFNTFLRKVSKRPADYITSLNNLHRQGSKKIKFRIVIFTHNWFDRFKNFLPVWLMYMKEF